MLGVQRWLFDVSIKDPGPALFSTVCYGFSTWLRMGVTGCYGLFRLVTAITIKLKLFLFAKIVRTGSSALPEVRETILLDGLSMLCRARADRGMNLKHCFCQDSCHIGPANMRPFKATSFLRVAIFTAIFYLCAWIARADMLALTNGDLYRGTIVSMDAANIVFQSEIQGRVVLPRSKVGSVTLHEVVSKPIVVAKPAAPRTTAPLVLQGTNPSPGVSAPVAPGSQADAVVQELRKQGIDPKLIDQVQEQIFGKASPEAAQKFNEIMGGLVTGQLSVGDIRKQAQSSINEIRAAKKELGGEAGEMLDGYLSILEKFMQESDSDSSITAAKPEPAKR